MQEMKAAMPRYYYTNDYLETDLLCAIGSLEEDVKYNSDIASIELNAKLASIQKSIASLSSGISAAIDLSGSTVLQMFDDEVQKYDIQKDGSYIAARDLFY